MRMTMRLRMMLMGAVVLAAMGLTLVLSLLLLWQLAQQPLGNPYQALSRFGLMTLAVVLLFTGVLLTAANAMGSWLTYLIDLLIQASDRIAEGDELYDPGRIAPFTPPELATLSAGLGKLAERLQARRREISTLNLELEERVAQRTVELRRRNADLSTSRATLYAVLESQTSGLVLVAPDGRIRYVNRTTEQLLELREPIYLGKPSADLYVAVAANCYDPEAVRAALYRSIEETDFSPVLAVRLPADRTRYVRCRTFRIRGATGRALGHGHILVDITQEQELDRLKSELIATVSHELRTPLTVIRASADSLLQTDVAWDAETHREFLVAIADESHRLQLLINNLLDLSKIEAGVLRLDLRLAPLGALIERSLQRARTLYPTWQLTATLAEGLPDIPLDETRMEEVFANLIENAVKYAGDRRKLQITAQQEGQQLLIGVHDQGSGIPADQIEQVFERFHRVDSSLTRKAGGSGLGLAICRGIVDAHGGRIWAESILGSGTTVWIALPIPGENMLYEDEGPGC